MADIPQRLLVGVAVLLTTSSAAARETASLVYERGPGAETCLDEQALRISVGMRLGYDPFEAGAAREVRASIRRRRPGFVATITIRGVDGVVLEHAPIASTSTDCAELAASLALAITIAVDPRSLTNPPVAPPPLPAAPSPTAPEPARASAAEDHPPASPPPPEAPENARLAFRFGAGGFASAGAVPGLSFGPTLFAGARLGTSPLAFGIEGRWDPPASIDGPNGGTVRGSLLLATIVPCLERGHLFGCALASGGPFYGRGTGVDNAGRHTSFYAAVGLRFGVEFPIEEHVSLRAQVDGLAPLVETRLRIAGAEAWSSPAITGAAGLGVVVHLR